MTQRNRPGLKPVALYLPLFTSLLFGINVWGQGIQQDNQNATAIQSATTPRTSVEVMPVFPGGDALLMEFVSKNLRYPISAQLAGIEGRVNARFVVGSDGVITNVEILKGVNPVLDQEVIRIILSMPPWTPGREKGVNVPVYYYIPVLFKLNGETPSKLLKQAKKAKKPTPIIQIIFNDKQARPVNIPNVLPRLPVIVVDDQPYQIVGLDWTKANDNDFFNALNLKQADIESTHVVKDKAAKKLLGERGKYGVIVIRRKVHKLVLKPVTMADDMPTFPGGDKALMAYISRNLVYPRTAQEMRIEGRVTVRFVIDENGKVGDVEVLKSVSPECDREAIRVIKGMPKWKPAKRDGVNVSSFYTMPFLFKLNR